VIGLSFDFELYNLIGFACYTSFNAAFYWSSYIQEQYQEYFHKENLVTLNDVFFAIHAVFATVITIIQIFIYERGNQKLSKVCLVLSGLGILSILILLFLAIGHVWQWILYLYYLSMVKLAISFIKYCPQVYLNFRRKSTSGWNIWNVLLDFSGGILSVTQIVFDAARKDMWSGITGDPAKFGLGFLSMFFDIIFIIQHYILYRHPPQDDGPPLRYHPVAADQ